MTPDTNVRGGTNETVSAVLGALRVDGDLIERLRTDGPGREPHELVVRGLAADPEPEPVVLAVGVPAAGGEWRGGYSRDRHLIQLSAVATSSWYAAHEWVLGDILDAAMAVLRGGIPGHNPGGIAGGSVAQERDDGAYMATQDYRVIKRITA